MKIFNRLSDRIAGKCSPAQSPNDTAHLLPSPSMTTGSPDPLHASLPYGFEWSPHPLTHGQTWMLSLNAGALSRDHKQTASLALLEK
jgi:hypothetical protein